MTIEIQFLQKTKENVQSFKEEMYFVEIQGLEIDFN